MTLLFRLGWKLLHAARHSALAGLLLSVAIAAAPDPPAGPQPAAKTDAPTQDSGGLQPRPIAGRVTDQDGKPVAKALLEWGYIHDPPEKWHRATTDAEGRYQLEVREYGVNYRLGASAPGMAPQEFIPRNSWSYISHRDLPRDADVPPPQTANFQLEPQHRLTGVVVDDNGQPIAGVKVQAQTAVTGFVSSFSHTSPPLPIPGPGPFTTTTDAEGRFALDHLPAEQIYLTLRSPHRHVNAQNYVVDRDITIAMSGSGRPGIVRAKVIDSQTGRPVPSFILIRRHVPKPETMNSATGQFELSDGLAEGGRYSLHIYTQDHAPAVAEIKASPVGSDEETTIELEPGQALLGKLVDFQTGKPLGGVPILYGVTPPPRDGASPDQSSTYFEWSDRKKYVDGYHPFTTVQHATTDEQGNFWFSEAPDRSDGTLFIIAPGFARRILRPADLSAPSEDGRVLVKLTAASTISGVLLRDGKPQPGIEVVVWKQAPRSNIDETFERVRTGADGAFHVDSLMAGIYGVSCVPHPNRNGERHQEIGTVVLGRGEQHRLEPWTIDKAQPKTVDP